MALPLVRKYSYRKLVMYTRLKGLLDLSEGYRSREANPREHCASKVPERFGAKRDLSQNRALRLRRRRLRALESSLRSLSHLR